jgi:hypothetical protein
LGLPSCGASWPGRPPLQPRASQAAPDSVRMCEWSAAGRVAGRLDVSIPVVPGAACVCQHWNAINSGAFASTQTSRKAGRHRQRQV